MEAAGLSPCHEVYERKFSPCVPTVPTGRGLAGLSSPRRQPASASALRRGLLLMVLVLEVERGEKFIDKSETTLWKTMSRKWI